MDLRIGKGEYMRKRFLSYITMVIVIFVVGVNVVKAEDYNFSTKIYKVDVVDDNFITRFNNGEFQEVKSGGTLNAGDTIAVGVYIDVKNPIGYNFEIKLNWDDSILEPFKDAERNRSIIKVDLRPEIEGGIYPNACDEEYCEWTEWRLSKGRYMDYYINNKPIIKVTADDNRELTKFRKSGNLFWLFLKVKDSIQDNSNLMFSFNRVESYCDFGRNLLDISTTSSNFKINGTKSLAYSLGDANGNGKIDFGDVMLSMAFYMVNLSMNAEEKDAADMNNDGRVTLSDTLLIIEKLFENN